MNQDQHHLLMVEDDEDDYLLTCEMLAEIERTRYDITWAKTYDEGLAALTSNSHDVCLLDYRLGASTGLELLREARAGGCDVAVIMLTGVGDTTIDLAAMEAGAADYLLKARLEPQLLERAIRYAITHKRAEKELKESAQRLQHYTQTLEEYAQTLESKNKELSAMHEELAQRNRELSAPLIPLRRDVLLMPLVGPVDTQRAQQVLETLLNGIARHRARVVILDVTGVPELDAQAAASIARAAQGARLLGAQVILTGIQPAMAQALTSLAVDMSGVMTFGALQNGVAHALTAVRRAGSKAIFV